MKKIRPGLVEAMEDNAVAPNNEIEIEVPELEKDKNAAILFSKNKALEEIKIFSEVKQSLESLTEDLLKTAAKGGLDRTGSEVLYITLENLYERAGVSTEGVRPALESFNAPGVRIGSTLFAAERITEKIKEISGKITDLQK
jgi:hypothetical protein